VRPAYPPSWLVIVAPHRVGRHAVPGLKIEIPAVSEDHARKLGAQHSHVRGGLPPWRPHLRASIEHTTAERVER
jgi:hypothetical protein